MKKIRKSTIYAFCLILVVGMLGSCGSGGDTETAEASGVTVYENAIVYTVAGDNWDQEAAEAFVVDADGNIAFVGSADDAKAEAGEGANVVDLGGRTVLPGMIDSHVHPPGTALTTLFEIDLYDAVTKDIAIKSITEFIEANPDLEVYWGSGYTVGIGGDPKGPRKEWLDEIESEKPIILTSNDGHNMWLNSAAFEVCGITEDTEPPTGGSIAKDPETGELWGTLTDAHSLITLEQEFTKEQQAEALAQFQQDMLGWGYTGIWSAGHSVDDDVLKEFDDSGDLKLSINLSARASETVDFDETMENALALRETFKDSEKISVPSMKFFADGVIEGMTGYLMEPYDEAAGLDPDYVSEPLWDPEALKDHFKEAMENEFQIHVHSIGDAATRDVVDAMVYAQEEVPDFEARNTITHLQVVRDEEKVRMGENNIIGCIQAFWHMKEPEWYDVVDEIALGEERAWKEYPVKSLMDEGVLITSSGDHPVSPINNPFWAIEASVTRNLENAEYYGVDDITDMDDKKWLLNPEERISLKAAIESYTINGAFQLFKEDQIGSLEAGKKANFIVLDKDPFAIDPIELDTVQVQTTVIGGNVEFGEF